MKKIGKLVLSVCLALACVLSLAACNEGAPQKSAGTGTGIMFGHGSCVTEAIVTVDGYGKPIKVLFDDIFPLKDISGTIKFDDKGADISLDKAASKVEVPPATSQGKPSYYYQYVRIGTHYFKADEQGKYNEIGVSDGITDFMTYYSSTDEGLQLYYDAFMSGNLYICKVVEEGTDKAVKVGDIYLLDSTAFNTSNGSMRKRYSKYWSVHTNFGASSMGFIGNMEMLENYLLAYGFDALTGDIKAAVTIPKEAGGKYNVIDGVTTGATLGTDAYIYLTAAYKGYQAALESQKTL